MKICVCIKYVPVISRITFDNETKTINRNGVPSEPNPFDLLGLNRALEIFEELKIPVNLTALCMGPPDAQNGLKQSLALGATEAVLLSDMKFAGSDTLITSKILSAYLREQNFDLVICGRNSSDSETGQVGPQIAEWLKIPHISDINHLEVDLKAGNITVFKNYDQGYEIFSSPLPSLVTVTEGIAEEKWPTKEQMNIADEIPISILTADDLKLLDKEIGADASPTWVEDIRIVENERLGLIIESDDPEVASEEASKKLEELLTDLNHYEHQLPVKTYTRANDSTGKDIWVISEQSNNELKQVSFEILGKARELSEFTNSKVVAVTFGNNIELNNKLLGEYGADSVINANHSELGPIWSDSTAQFLSNEISTRKPFAVLFPSTSTGKDLASRIAVKLKLGLTGDAIDLELDSSGRLIQIKPALGGNIIAPILSKTLPYMVTLREGMLSPILPQTGFEPDIEKISPQNILPSKINYIQAVEQHDIQLTYAHNSNVCVGIGMGAGSKENVSKIVQYSKTLGEVSIATSRNVVHEGWLPHQIQVGISGISISPKVYIAIGLRGAFNHTVGIQKAGIIVAINKNKRHPIFKGSDIGIVGEWETLIPVLFEKLEPIIKNLSSTS